ncbi:MAG: aldehyde ferredoxin oxidoreductase family protein [Archaeoglobi archaeon]|nr:aldehyde ferredoxin oxidoreductase family protein [Archaeoglobi archaeon]
MRDRVLRINLTDYSYEVEERPELVEEWIGGVGIAVQLFRESMRDLKADPLSEENVIVFANGPFTLAYPYASKTVAMFKSPLTGELGESHAGGRTATALASAGYTAMVIEGRSDKPVYVVVDEDRVHFRDGRSLRGIRDSLILSRILAEIEGGKGERSIVRAGYGGEKLVRFACVTTETYRHFGRLGLGAVFGSKNLLAVVVRGKKTFRPRDPERYREVYREIYRLGVESDAMKKYHLLGTAENVLPLRELRALPVKNLTENYIECEDISGESLAEHSLGRRIACAHCPTACIHIAVLRQEYENERYFYKTLMISYDYELIYALGSMIGVTRRDDLLRLIHRVETYGLDAISTGVCLAWATEALERGVVSEKETIVRLSFGDADSYLKAIDYLVEQPNEFYEALARGVRFAARKYGGEEFAIAVAGNEIPGYNTGYANYVGLLIGMRHSHLDNGGYSLDQKQPKLEAREAVDRLVKEEMWRQVLSSLVVCFFARGVFSPELVSRAFEPLGVEMGVDELNEAGRRIYLEKVRLKKEMGYVPSLSDLPERVFEVETPAGVLRREYFEEALDYYMREYYSKV